MKRRNKGRKIYKTKEKNYYGKSPLGKFLSGSLTVLLIGGIGFLGYSLAEPIINYNQHKGDSPESDMPEGTTTTAETTAAASETHTEVVTEAVTEADVKKTESYMAAALSEKDMSTIETLRAALEKIPGDSGIEYVEVPLKSRGGAVWYGTSVFEAQTSGAVMSSMTLGDIKAEIESKGFVPAASISVFDDSKLPAAYPETGYTKIPDGSQWLDESPENGGKPWASPYSQKAVDYNFNLVNEISAAGFEQVICSGLVFPDFSDSDLELLDEELGRNERCMAMISAANLLYSKALSNGASMLIEVEASDILSGNTDILQPMLLSSNNIILNIDLNELTDAEDTIYDFNGTALENAEKCLGLVNDKLTDFNTTIRLSGASLTAAELLEIKDNIAEYGYDSFVIG